MTTMTLHDTDLDEQALIRTARIAGLFYLSSIVTAVFGYFIIPAQIFDVGDAAATLTHLTGQEALARFGIVMELGSLTCQALLSLWFYRLFRSVDAFLAVAILVLGMVNAVTILGSTAFLATALNVALDPTLGGAAATVQLMYVLRSNVWLVVSVFFGLWLIPMGLLVLRSGWMPRLMGELLIAGGVGYVLRTIIVILAPDAESVAAVLVAPSLSEFWMAGYLVVRGVRPRARHMTHTVQEGS